MFLGLRTVIYPAPKLIEAKNFFTQILGIEPYFNEPFYVGYNVGGYELGLLPDADTKRGAVTYWGVKSVKEALALLESFGATVADPTQDVGDGIRTASVQLPASLGEHGAVSLFGVIENPHFSLAV